MSSYVGMAHDLVRQQAALTAGLFIIPRSLVKAIDLPVRVASVVKADRRLARAARVAGTRT